MSTEQIDETVSRALSIGPELLDLPLMEVLIGGRDRVERSAHHDANDPEGWYFSDWNRCTCGHIYGAATGSLPKVMPEYDWAVEAERIAADQVIQFNSARDTLIRSPSVVDGIYEEALRYIADTVLDEHAGDDGDWTSQYREDGYYSQAANLYRLVSDLTVDLSGRLPETEEHGMREQGLRGAAVYMLNLSIERLEAEQAIQMRAKAEGRTLDDE